MRAAIVYDNEVVNVVELPDDYNPKREGSYSPPEGHRIEMNSQLEVGSRFENGSWKPSTPPALPPVVASTQEQFDSLTTLLVSKGVLTSQEASDMKRPKPRPTPS